MALSAFALRDIFARAIRSLTERGTEHRGWYLARDIMGTMGLSPTVYGYQSDMALHNAVWSVVKQAQAAVGSASVISPQSHLTPTPPRVPGIGATEPEYLYRVVVEVRAPDGSRHSTAIDVRSDILLDYDDIRQLASEMVANITPREGDTPGRLRISGMTDYQVSRVVVLYSGRR